MTDGTGLVQHALYSVPDPVHGYSVDDQARALMVCVAHAHLSGAPLPREAYIYLSYIRYAARKDGTFHNFLGYDRRWLDDRGSDDAQGRVLWALAHAARYSPEPRFAGAAAYLFASSQPVISILAYPRSWAFTIFALSHRVHNPGGEVLLKQARELADRLVERFDAEASPEWRWFEDSVIYCNGSMPAALLLAHEMTGEARYREIGLCSLEWLVSVLFNDAGELRLVGQNGWYPRGGEKAAFDEQCVDAQGTVEAALIALRVTGDPVWRERALAAFDWFHGRNALGSPLLDTTTWGCYDAITPRGMNENMGAESIVCYLLAYLDLVDSGVLTLDGNVVP